MTRYRTSTLIGVLAIASATFAVAQKSPTSESAPNAASSPAQRSATASPATEAPTTQGSDPSTASTPHQKQVTGGATKEMKDCMAQEQAKEKGLSKNEAKKTCTDR